MTIPQALQMAVQAHQAGRLAEAETFYRQILAAQPNHADAQHYLGVVAHQAGRHDLAVEWIGKAIRLAPNNPFAYCNLGAACRALGQLDEAMAACRRAIALKPDYPEAYNNLATALVDSGHFDEAIAACRRSIALQPAYAEAHNNLGNALRARGDLDEAIAAYRRALQCKPGGAELYFNLGIALGERGQPEEAAVAYRRALEIQPDYLEARLNLGNTLRERGLLDEASAAYHDAIRLKPDYAQAHYNLGIALRERGRAGEAAAAYRRAIELQPHLAEAHNNLGHLLWDEGRLDEAIAACRRAIEIKPDYPEAHANLGNALRDRGRIDEAIAAFDRALQLQPGNAEAHSNLGIALWQGGRLDEAIGAYRRALEIEPNLPEVHNNLGATLRERGRLDEALAASRRALELKPDLSEAHNNVGNVLKDQGDLDGAIAAFRKAIELQPESAWLYSNVAYTLHFHPGYDEAVIAEEHARWNRLFSEPAKQFHRPHGNDRGAERPLRIGYVSPDFRDHVVGRNLLPLFEKHDRGNFEIVCYSGVTQPDRLTGAFRGLAHEWRDTVGVSDEALADLIREDRVDILVDLSQHMAGNRLPVFARKPAPVQVSFAGYPESAGVEAIEYRISDRHLAAASADGAGARRERVRLLDSFWCYDPCGVDVGVHGAPALEKGAVSFACLGNFCKVNEAVLRLWARALRKVKDSRLMISSPEGSHRRRTRDFLEREGIEAGRVEFVEFLPRREYLELYHGVDIVLDTFPYNGHNTSLDALWMGAPVVTLAGKTAVSRAGLSQLTNIGLPEWIAHSESEYVDIAVSLAGDLARLAELRGTLRERMQDSPLMDAARFARQIEQAFREMWREWVSG